MDFLTRVRFFCSMWLVRASSRQWDLLLETRAIETIKLRPIVRVNASDLRWGFPLHLVQSLKETSLPSIQYRSCFHPSGEDLGLVDPDSPSAESPQCATKSTSLNPGCVASHRSVLRGALDFTCLISLISRLDATVYNGPSKPFF